VDAKRAKPENGLKDGVSMSLNVIKTAPPRLSPEEKALGSGWNHIA
jgi:hypothetical protein